jgi:hypothetical protein
MKVIFALTFLPVILNEMDEINRKLKVILFPCLAKYHAMKMYLLIN